MKNICYLFVFSTVIFYSSLNAQWVKTNLSYNNGPVTCFTTKLNGSGGTNLFAGTWGGIFLSTDEGSSWQAMNNELTKINVFSLVISDSNIFAGTNAGVYLSTNNGTSWSSVDTSLANHPVFAIAVSDNNIFAGTGNRLSKDGEVFISTDNGTSWSLPSIGLAGNWIRALAINGTNLFAGTSVGYAWPGHGVFLSTNNGTSWTSVNNGLTDSSITALAVSGKDIYAGTQYGGVFLSTNNGTNWTAVNSGLTNTHINTLAVIPNGIGGTNLFAGTSDFYFGTISSGVFLSTNNGASWTEVNNGLKDTSVIALAVSSKDPSAVFSTNLIVGTNGGVYRRLLSEILTGVEGQGNKVPSQFILEQNYPNPFNPSTKINYQIPTAGIVSLKVYDVLGKEVATLVNEEKPVGNYEVNFSAKGGSASGGNTYSLSSGIYFYKLQAGSFVETKKMILLK